MGGLAMTPTARTLAKCRKRGWLVQNVEQTIRIPGGRTFKRDLFGVIDLVCVTLSGILGVQVTSGTNHAARRTKALAEPQLRLWLEAGGRFAIWSWSKRGAAGKRKAWTLREEAITLEMFHVEAKEAA
jgi:hypothetical protein